MSTVCGTTRRQKRMLILWRPSINSDPLTRHCKRVYRAGTDTSGIFLALLKLYLRPTLQSSSNLLEPALELISRHGPRLDAVETLKLLPPLVTADDIRPFLIDSLRIPVFDTRVVREINKARNDQLSRRLMALQSRRVKVTDSRMLVLNINCRSEWNR